MTHDAATQPTSAGAATADEPPRRVTFDDPHAAGARLRSRSRACGSLTGIWRWLLLVMTAATIALCVNQQFTLRFFVGYTQLNTEYFYLLILCMLPFTFVIFPGSETRAARSRALVRRGALPRHRDRLGVSSAQRAQGRGARLGVRRRAAPIVFAAGLALWVMLMEALRRTGGWSLLLSVLPFTVYPLFADSAWLGPLRGTQSTVEQATAYHVLSNESLLGIPIQAFAETVIGFLVFGTALMLTGAGKFFINLAFALCGTFRGGAAKVCIFASGLLGMMSGSDRVERADGRHHDHPRHEAHAAFAPPTPAPSKPAPRRAPCWRRL